MDEMTNEKENEKRRDELYVRMREIRQTPGKTTGDVLRYVRGKGLVKRDCKEH